MNYDSSYKLTEIKRITLIQKYSDTEIQKLFQLVLEPCEQQLNTKITENKNTKMIPARAGAV